MHGVVLESAVDADLWRFCQRERQQGRTDTAEQPAFGRNHVQLLVGRRPDLHWHPEQAVHVGGRQDLAADATADIRALGWAQGCRHRCVGLPVAPAVLSLSRLPPLCAVAPPHGHILVSKHSQQRVHHSFVRVHQGAAPGHSGADCHVHRRADALVDVAEGAVARGHQRVLEVGLRRGRLRQAVGSAGRTLGEDVRVGLG